MPFDGLSFTITYQPLALNPMISKKILLHGIAIAALTVATAAPAQSSSGNIVGDGKTGQTVVVTGVDTGFRRELKIEKDGKFQIRRVPTGSYQVVRVQPDGSIDPIQEVVVRIGSTARVMDARPIQGQDRSGPGKP